jgi:hypothetical protein
VERASTKKLLLAKARHIFSRFMARLKLCPDTKSLQQAVFGQVQATPLLLFSICRVSDLFSEFGISGHGVMGYMIENKRKMPRKGWGTRLKPH